MIFMIDGQPVMDDFIRYEHLSADIGRACKTLGMDLSAKLGNYRGGFRKRPEPFQNIMILGQKDLLSESSLGS